MHELCMTVCSFSKLAERIIGYQSKIYLSSFANGGLDIIHSKGNRISVDCTETYEVPNNNTTDDASKYD